MIDAIFDFILSLVGSNKTAVILFSVLPLSEARLAIPIGIKYGLSPFTSFFYAFLGSSITAVCLVILLSPLIRLMSKIKLFSRLSGSVISGAQQKAQRLGKRQMLGLGAFVSLPLPLTGIWTGSLIACILDMPLGKAIISLTVGNLISAAIVTVMCVFFEPYINWIVGILTGFALIMALILLVKTIKPKKKNASCEL